MSFDKSEPADNTKIRNLGVVIRPNWVAIEEGDSTFKPYAINLQDRTPLGVSNDPSTISGASISYVKQDGSGNPELYSRDGSGNIIQLTAGGRIGGPSTNYRINNMRFGSGSVDYGVNNVISAAVRWNSSGTALYAFGCTIAKSGTGTYVVTLSTARSNTNYWAVASPEDSGSNIRGGRITINSTTQFTIKMVNSSADARDVGGFCMVAGGF